MYISKRYISGNAVPIGSNLFGICTAAGDAVTKAVTMPDFNALVEGVTIHVYFSNANTASAPLLRVGSTNAVHVRCNGTNDGQWAAGSTVSFTYYGGYWQQNDFQVLSSQSDIIQYGTGTISGYTYYYEYYSNGIKKLWITVTGTTAIGTSGAGGYVSEQKTLDISALGLTTIYNIQTEFSYGYYAGSSHIYSHSTSQITWYFWNAVAVTNRAYTMFIEIVGS